MAALTSGFARPRGLLRLVLCLVLALFLANLTIFVRKAVSLEKPPLSLSWEVFQVQDPEAPPGAGIQDFDPDGPDGPGLPQLMAVFWLEPDPGHYAYGHKPGPTGQPTDLAVTPPPGMNARVFHPQGEYKPDVFDPSLIVEVYQGRTPLFVGLYGEQRETLLLAGSLRLLLCSDTSCWPVQEEVLIEVPNLDPAALPEARSQIWWPQFLAAMQDAGDLEAPTPTLEADPAPQPPVDAAIAEAPELLQIVPRYFQPKLEVRGLGKAALLAFIAGLILNFMPCVLPVVSLKLSSLLSASGIDDTETKIRHFREHNIFFAAGIMLFFVILGVVLGAAGLAWGQLFQKPLLVMAVTAVIFGLGLSLFGVFDLPIVDLKGGVAGKNNKTQALFTGLLATLLATPCSGPFLGGVLGWTLTQAPAIIVSVFLFIGAGMASPYVFMAFRPELVRLFPRPGNWTVHLERLVGFFLMATCVYLLFILPLAYKLQAMILLLGTAFAAWIWGSWTSLLDPRLRILVIRGIALTVLLAVALWTLRHPVQQEDWLEFSGSRFRDMLGVRNMVIDFTADWCPNCKVLEKTTLAPRRLAKWKDKYDIVFLQADLTEHNPQAQALLEALGSQSIPVVALFPQSEDSTRPLVLRDMFTPSQMDDALEQTFAPR